MLYSLIAIYTANCSEGGGLEVHWKIRFGVEEAGNVTVSHFTMLGSRGPERVAIKEAQST